MRVTIIDDTHIMLVASSSEAVQYANHIGIKIDDRLTFVCSSEPSSDALFIERPVGGSIFNISIDISPRFDTKDLLIVYLEMDDVTYPFVIPCYDNEELLQIVARKSGIIDPPIECRCNDDISMIHPIILYYGFKLALATFDIRTAIKYWDKLLGPFTNPAYNCKCHGK